MAIVESLDGVELSLRIGSVRVPLEPLTREPPTAAKGAGTAPQAKGAELRAPRIEAPEFAKTFQLQPMQKIALQELLQKARSADVKIILPLPRQVVGSGVAKLDLTSGHDAIISLHVEDRIILRDETRGTIQPAVDLPLGVAFNGLYLSDDGDVKAELDNFVDINLSRWSKRVPQIPRRIDELLSMIFDRPKRDDDEKSKSKLDLSELRVEARHVEPRAEAVLDLGPMGRAGFGPETLLDIDWSREKLSIRGRAHVADGHVEGKGFAASKINGQCQIEVTMTGPKGARHLEVTVHDLDLHVDSGIVVTPNGSRIVLGEARVDDGDIEVSISPEHGVEVSAHLAHIHGLVDGGVISFKIADEATTLKISPTRIDGGIQVDGRRIALDIGVDAGQLTIDRTEAHLGLVDLDLTEVVAGGKGHLTGATDAGFLFTGALETRANAAGTRFHLEGASGELAPGSRARLVVRELFVAPDGLQSLEADGAVAIRLHSGRVPLGSAAALEFVDGAEGKATLRSLEVARGRPWPIVDVGIEVIAGSAPFTLGQLVDLPSGHAVVSADVSLDGEGVLSVADAAVTLAIDDDLGIARDAASPGVEDEAPSARSEPAEGPTSTNERSRDDGDETADGAVDESENDEQVDRGEEHPKPAMPAGGDAATDGPDPVRASTENP